MNPEKLKHVKRLLDFELLDEQIAKIASVRFREVDEVRQQLEEHTSCPHCHRTIHPLAHYWSHIKQTNQQLDIPLLHLFHVSGPDQRKREKYGADGREIQHKTHWCYTFGGRSPWDVMRKVIASAMDEGKLARRPRLFPDGLGWMDLSISYCKSVIAEVPDDPQLVDEFNLPDLGRRAIFV